MIAAALYIDPRGPYTSMLGVDAWDIDRDATTYDGPFPVVAHPPCGSWSLLKHLARPDAAGRACGPRAVEQVRRWGGVLEQPKASGLWAACGLPMPGEPPDAYGGVSIEVAQVDWGHVARKRTWLYLVDVEVPTTFPSPRVPTHWVSGSRTAIKGPVPPGIKVCSPRQRRRTPPLFAEWLVALASTATRGRRP